jgi:cellulose synthase/poly-beta-1,6-N-acetylglucosamine synthase-like glycosyltransferase
VSRAAATAFWAGAAGTGWVLAGYPLALATRPARPLDAAPAAGPPPRVTVVVPTYREIAALGPKLATVAALDHPADRLEVVVVVDGGDPALVDAARAALPTATVLTQTPRAGKPAALNRALRHATGDGVSGRWAERGSAYDRYEHLLRTLEHRSGSTAGVFGGLLAIRRDRLPLLPEDVVNDDLWLLCALVRRGGRVAYAPAATAVEPPLGARAQHERRGRIAAGRVQLAAELQGLPPGFRLRLLTHTFGRLALPFLLLGMLGGSAARARRPRWRRVALAQAALYGAGALAAAGVRPPGPAGRVADALGQFAAGNAAVAAGVVRAAAGRQDVRWTGVRR